MPWGYTFLDLLGPPYSSHLAVQTLVYISEYTVLGSIWHRFLVTMALFGTVLALFTHCLVLPRTVSWIWSFPPNKSIVATAIWDPGIEAYGTLGLRHMGPWIWDYGTDIPTGWALAIPTGYTPGYYPGYTPAPAPVHACTRTVPATPCSTLSAFCQNCC